MAMSESAVIDWEYLRSLRDLQAPDEPDIVEELIQLFASEADGRRALLADAVRRRDVEAIRRAAHSLRGSAGQIGALQLARALAVLEAAATVADGKMDALADAVTDALRDALAALDEGDGQR